MDPASLVNTFNSLPRNKLTPSGVNPNHWHISLRHVPLHPPGHLLFLINPATRFVYTPGPIPPSAQNEPITAKASMLALLLIQAFNNGLGVPRRRNCEEFGRPWSWVCNDAEMAGVVCEKIKGLGVQAPEGVGVAEEAENRIADEEWERFVGMLLPTRARPDWLTQ